MNERFEQVICMEHEVQNFLAQGYVVQHVYTTDNLSYDEYDEVTEEQSYRKQNQWGSPEETWTPKYRVHKRRYRLPLVKFVMARRETLSILYGASNGKT